MYELYTLWGSVDDKSTSIQFIVTGEDEFLYVGDDGEPTEVLQQSGWSFQDEQYQKIYEEFIEEVRDLDVLEWTIDMDVGETLNITDSLTITRES